MCGGGGGGPQTKTIQDHRACGVCNNGYRTTVNAVCTTTGDNAVCATTGEECIVYVCSGFAKFYPGMMWGGGGFMGVFIYTILDTLLLSYIHYYCFYSHLLVFIYSY